MTCLMFGEMHSLSGMCVCLFCLLYVCMFCESFSAEEPCNGNHKYDVRCESECMCVGVRCGSECMCVGASYAHTYLRVSACVWGCHVSMTPPHTSHDMCVGVGVSCEDVCGGVILT